MGLARDLKLVIMVVSPTFCGLAMGFLKPIIYHSSQNILIMGTSSGHYLSLKRPAHLLITLFRSRFLLDQSIKLMSQCGIPRVQAPP
jgi:uncharacterized protein involved in exopolysaccharide biosynthesis